MRTRTAIAIVFLALAFYVSLTAPAPLYGDGSDPMPLCRPTAKHACPLPPSQQ